VSHAPVKQYGAAMLSRDALILSTGTVGNPALSDLIEACGAGDYSAIAVWPADLQRWRAAGIEDAIARARLDDAGIGVAQVDCLLMWVLGRGSTRAVAEEEDLFAAAETLGAPVVSVIGPGDDRFSVEQLAETFAGVCDRGAARGFTIALEVSPWKGNLDLATAVRLLELTGRDNSGLVIDSWHMFRGATPVVQLHAVPATAIASVQVSDAPRAAQADLVAETMGARLLPGEGDIDLAEFLQSLDRQLGNQPGTRSGTVAVTVEVLNDQLRAQGPSDAARLTAQATRRVLASALH
jgi:sugar phosphate isomerase/epimerase